MEDEQMAGGESASASVSGITEMLEQAYINSCMTEEQTSSASQESAASRFFAITELFEHILLDLNFVERLAVIRVCRRWKNVIETSSALAPSQNMFLIKPKPDYDSISLHVCNREWQDLPPDQQRTVVLNPVLFEISKTLLDMTEEQFGRYCRPEASWWKMQVCYPPVMEGFGARDSLGVTLADVLWRKAFYWQKLREGLEVDSGSVGWGYEGNGEEGPEVWKARQFKGPFRSCVERRTNFVFDEERGWWWRVADWREHQQRIA